MKFLFKRLRTLRKKLADEQQVPPYIVFSDRTLHEMCRYYPLILPDMAKMTGVGDAKLERYGADFTEMIRAYLDENPGITFPEETPSFVAPAKPVAKKARGETLEKTYELFVKGLSIGQISGARNLAESTVTGHIEQLIKDGREIEMGRLLDAEKLDKIGDLFLTLQSWELNPVVEHFNETVSYDEAKLVRAYMRQKGS